MENAYPNLKPSLLNNTPFITTLALLFISIVIGGGAFYFHQAKINQIESESKREIDDLTKKLSTLDNSSSQSKDQYITIPEWGIKIKTVKELKNYSYSVVNGEKKRTMHFMAAPASVPSNTVSCLANPSRSFPESQSLFALSAYDEDQVKNIPNPWPSGGKKVFQNQKYTFFIFHPQAINCMDTPEHEQTVVRLLEKMLKENISDI